MLRALVPNVETLVYSRMSLRDKGLDRCLGPSLGSNQQMAKTDEDWTDWESLPEGLRSLPGEPKYEES